MIRTLTKLSSLQFFTTENYVRENNVLCETIINDSSIFVIITDENVLQNARKTLENKKLTVKKKLDSLLKLKSGEKYQNKMSEEDKIKHEKQVINLY